MPLPTHRGGVGRWRRVRDDKFTDCLLRLASILENECVEAGSDDCVDAEDTVTGDEEFECGEDGMRRSMVCIEPVGSSELYCDDDEAGDDYWDGEWDDEENMCANTCYDWSCDGWLGYWDMDWGPPTCENLENNHGCDCSGCECVPLDEETDDTFEDHVAKCEQCLYQGKDYCIEENVCITRGTAGCAGSEDHITGDEDFAECYEGQQHSMICIEPIPVGEGECEESDDDDNDGGGGGGGGDDGAATDEYSQDDGGGSDDEYADDDYGVGWPHLNNKHCNSHTYVGGGGAKRGEAK